jgi:hypothetical protein
MLNGIKRDFDGVEYGGGKVMQVMRRPVPVFPGFFVELEAK